MKQVLDRRQADALEVCGAPGPDPLHVLQRRLKIVREHEGGRTGRQVGAG
jgi:hypothetical protein